MNDKNRELNLQFEVAQDRMLARPTSHSSRFVRMLVTAPSADETARRQPVSVAFVLDRSGSMSGQKLEQAKRAVSEGVALLDERDQFALVTFDNFVDVALPMVSKSRGAKMLPGVLSEIGARNQTNLCDGYLLGAEQFRDVSSETLKRIILVSDGQANVGETSLSALKMHATELRRRGVNTATLGIGEGFNEALLGAMANGGGGAARWAEHSSQIPAAIKACIEEVLETVLTRVRIDVRVPGARFELISLGDLSGGEGACTVDLGDMVADQQREVVLRVHLPKGDLGSNVRATVELTAESVSGRSLSHRNDVAWTYASGREIEAELHDPNRDRTIDLVVARHYAEIAKAEATELNRRGRYEEAKDVLLQKATRIERYADRRELKAIVGELKLEAKKWSAPRDERTRKQAYFAMLNVRGSRHDDGSPRRGA